MSLQGSFGGLWPQWFDDGGEVCLAEAFGYAFLESFDGGADGRREADDMVTRRAASSRTQTGDSVLDSISRAPDLTPAGALFSGQTARDAGSEAGVKNRPAMPVPMFPRPVNTTCCIKKR